VDALVERARWLHPPHAPPSQGSQVVYMCPHFLIQEALPSGGDSAFQRSSPCQLRHVCRRHLPSLNHLSSPCRSLSLDFSWVVWGKRPWALIQEKVGQRGQATQPRLLARRKGLLVPFLFARAMPRREELGEELYLRSGEKILQLFIIAKLTTEAHKFLVLLSSGRCKTSKGKRTCQNHAMGRRTYPYLCSLFDSDDAHWLLDDQLGSIVL